MLRFLNLYRTINRTFGFRLRPLGTFGLLQLHRLINASTRGLDHLFFPRIRRATVDRPIFILGNPRSGTTFVHRFLLHTDELCALELWEMLLPAITARKTLGGLVTHLAPLSPARYHTSEAHETSLRDVETDDAMAFFHFVDGGFLWSYYQAWEDQWGSDLSRRVADLSLDPAAEARFFRYMEACWRRNQVYKGKNRNLIKSVALTPLASRLLDRYPAGRLIYLVRDPIETIPSGISLLTGVLERSYDLWNRTTPAQRERYFENLYQAACFLYRSFHDPYVRGDFPEDRVMVVTYPMLMNDLERTMERLVAFLGMTPGPEFFSRVRDQAEKQRTRKSGHAYSLERFGLEADRIRTDLAYVYKTYGLDG